MFEWWNSLGITMQVFYCIAIPATLIIVIQTILLKMCIRDSFSTATTSPRTSIIRTCVPVGIASCSSVTAESYMKSSPAAIVTFPSPLSFAGIGIYTCLLYTSRCV